MTRRAPLTAAVAAAALAFALPAAPAAADDIGWSVQPAGAATRNHFVYELGPGEQVTDTVRVTNRAPTPMTFTVYGTDAYTTVDGGFDLLAAKDAPRDVGSWISLGARAYTVPGGRHLDIPFRLAVPTNASPGDHAGGVIASVVTPGTTADGQQVTVDRRVAARVYLRVTGPTSPSVRAESVGLGYEDGTATVTYQLRNDGNLRVTGLSRVRLTGPFGIPLARTADADVPELLPGATITVTERVTGVAPAGRLTATVEVQPATADGGLPPVARSASVWAIPWLVLAAVAAIVAALVAYQLIRRRRRRAAA